MTKKSETTLRGEREVSSVEISWQKLGILSIQRGKWHEEKGRA